MVERFFVVLGQVMTLFLLMGVGFGLGRVGKISGHGTTEFSALLLYVVTPCIIIDSFQTDYDPALLQTLGMGVACQCVCYGLYAVIVSFFFRRDPQELRAPMRFGAMYGNTGFMGLPLIQAIMGDEAVIFAVVALVVFNLWTWSHGLIMMSGRDQVSLRKMLINPGMLGLLGGLPLFLTRTTLPGPLYSAVGFVGSVNTPLAMIVIGAQMARADLGSTFRDKKLYGASAIKLLLIPIFTALVMLPFRGNHMLYVAAVILSGAPTAGVTSMFAEKFNKSPERTAQLVSFSTLLSIFTLPLIAVMAETIAA
ncbi:MAG: AEC family transporter [Oscillospiraceae bacterium]|nr:AEC family transporter [Oscillospiraceae bacterium]